MRVHDYEIKAADIGKPYVTIHGKVYLASNFIGCILPMDVGKLVYVTNGILQVENNEQFTARKNKACNAQRVLTAS